MGIAQARQAGPLCFGPYRLVGAQGPLLAGEREIALRPKVAEVLWYLACQAGEVVSKETLITAVWPQTFISEGVLAVCIRELRQALDDDAQTPRYIQTVHRRGYRFIAPLSAAAPAPPEYRPGVQAVVGREGELRELHACYERAASGQRQVLFVTGEAGIGKTALVDAFLQRLAGAEPIRLARGQCVEQYGAGEPYLPLLEALHHLCQGQSGEAVKAQLHRFAPSWLWQLPAALDEAARAALQRHVQGLTPERMRRELADALAALSREQPLLVVLEDLHWSDPSTVEALALLARRTEPARLALIGTYRPVELIVREHPLKRVKQELQLHGQCCELTVGYLNQAAVGAYLARYAPHLAGDDVVTLIHRRTEGLPLFIASIVEYLTQPGGLEGGGLKAADPAERLAAIIAALPAGLQQFIELQFEALSAGERQVLEAASVAGAEFATAAVAAGLASTEASVEDCCEVLARRGQFIAEAGLVPWPDGTASGRYAFRHTLYQEVLYKRIGAGRRVRLHRAIGARLAAGYGERSQEVALELAHHFETGHDAERAVEYLAQATETAVQRNAHREASQLIGQALALLAGLPQTPERDHQELRLLIRQGPALSALQGYAAAAVKQVYRRALALAEQVGDAAQRAAVLSGLCIGYITSADYAQAQAMGERLLHLGDQTDHAGYRLEAHRTLGGALLFRGELAQARAHFEQSLTLYDPQQHRHHAVLYGIDPGVGCRYLLARALWLLGYPTQALAQSQAALSDAQALIHPYSQVCALAYLAYLHQLRREPAAAQTQAEAMLAYAAEQGFVYWAAIGTMLRGWALAQQGQATTGIAQLQQGLSVHQATGVLLLRPYFLALLAEAQGQAGEVEAAVGVLAEALALAASTRERWYEAELQRLTGELRLKQRAADAPLQAQSCFQQALSLARSQGAKTFELRAAASLARLWHDQGKHKEARRVLAPVYNGFTEGFESVDLQETRAVLEGLAAKEKMKKN